MAVMRFNFLSQVLSLCVDVTITIPDGRFIWSADPAERAMRHVRDQRVPYREGMKLQTLYLLHGGSDDDTTLLRQTRLERYAERNCVMTVTPQVKDSFFLDTRYGFRYFTFITEELPVVVRSLFASSPQREDNFLLGMAMGGNAALAVAFKRPDLFQAVVDLSGGIGCSLDGNWFREEMTQLSGMQRLISAFGPVEEAVGGPFDLSAILHDPSFNPAALPRLFMAVGADDFIYDVVRKDHAALCGAGIPVHYEEMPNLGHDWDFWDGALAQALDVWLPLRRKPECC